MQSQMRLRPKAGKANKALENSQGAMRDLVLLHDLHTRETLMTAETGVGPGFEMSALYMSSEVVFGGIGLGAVGEHTAVEVVGGLHFYIRGNGHVGGKLST